jgi:hypothetical protein
MDAPSQYFVVAGSSQLSVGRSISSHPSPLIMSGRQGGKAKPLKAPKKEKKELDEVGTTVT